MEGYVTKLPIDEIYFKYQFTIDYFQVLCYNEFGIIETTKLEV